MLMENLSEFSVFSLFFVIKTALSVHFIVVLFKWWYAYHWYAVAWWDGKKFMNFFK